MEKYYSRKQIAELLSVNPRTVWNWIKDGTIKAIRLPTGDLRIAESELERLIKESGKVSKRGGKTP